MAQNGEPLSKPRTSDDVEDLKGSKIEHFEHTDVSNDEDGSTAQLAEKQRKKLSRKLDLRIMPVLILLYLLSYIDRANIGNAKIEGMNEDIGLSSTQYNIVLSIFFVTYILFEVPSNFILERYFKNKPSHWIGIITVAWGIAMTMHGIVHKFEELMAVRLIMGVFEAGLFPGAILFMNKWYDKYELATRFGLFYVGSALAGAFSGLLAYALAKMDGLAGVQGWRWIFIMEGIATVVVGALVPIILADTPENPPKWLSEEEARYLTVRNFEKDGGKQMASKAKGFSGSLLLTVISDWQFYLMMFVCWSNTVPTYGMKFTMPQIIKNMGFSTSNAQLLSVPPYIAGAISAYGFGRLSDRFRRRAYFIIVNQSIVVVSYAILTPLAPKISSNVGACYFAVVLANIGLYPISPGATSWISNNLAGPNKRAIGIAYMTSLINLGGIFASYVFIDDEKPGYPTGFGSSMAFAITGILVVITLEIIYTRINRKRAQMSEAEIREKYTEEELAEMGDRSPLYRYTL